MHRRSGEQGYVVLSFLVCLGSGEERLYRLSRMGTGS